MGWDGGSDELLAATAAPAAPRTAECFAKALHEAGTEVQTRAASPAPGWELPAGSASCSLPPQPPALGWGQMLLQPGGRSIGQSRAEASKSRSGSVGESCLRDGAPGARQSSISHAERRPAALGVWAPCSQTSGGPRAAAVVCGGLGKQRGRKKLQWVPGGTSRTGRS